MYKSVSCSKRPNGARQISLPVKVAFRVQPRRVEPFGYAKPLQLLVVSSHVRLAVVRERSQLAVMLQLVLEFRQTFDNLLTLLLRLRVIGFYGSAVDIVNGASLTRSIVFTGNASDPWGSGDERG